MSSLKPNLNFVSISTSVERFASGESAVGLAEEALERLNGCSGDNSVATLMRKEALEQAAAVDLKRAEGQEVGPLAGVAIAVKENIAVEGVPLRAGSKMLESFIPPYSATVVEKLRQAGATIVATTNMDEMAAGSTGTLSAFGMVTNPRFPQFVPGGSSSGSAAVVARGAVAAALGTDTGGSIRLPASCCGVVGLKPTYGAVSRWGVVAHAGSLDQVGPIAASVRDAALLYDAICGVDAADSQSSNRAVGATAAALDLPLAPLRIGVPQEGWRAPLKPELGAVLTEAVERLSGDGHRLVQGSLRQFDHWIATYNILSTAEFVTSTNRYDGVRFGYRAAGAGSIEELMNRSRSEGFGAEVKRRLLLGNHSISGNRFGPYFSQAQKMRRLIAEDFEALFGECDLIALPTLPGAPMTVAEAAAEPTALRFNNIYTAGANLAGLPALSLPVGLYNGAPAALQLVAPPFGEQKLLQLAHRLEELCGR